MQDVGFYFRLGWEHIISREALDHQLFIAALAVIYLLKDWKQVLILVTAFTIGHSLTLALSVFDVIRFNSKWVEFLIPVTIVITALSTAVCSAIDWLRLVPGMRLACTAMSLSSRLGTNSVPSRVAPQPPREAGASRKLSTSGCSLSSACTRARCTPLPRPWISLTS